MRATCTHGVLHVFSVYKEGAREAASVASPAALFAASHAHRQTFGNVYPRLPRGVVRRVEKWRRLPRRLLLAVFFRSPMRNAMTVAKVDAAVVAACSVTSTATIRYQTKRSWTRFYNKHPHTLAYMFDNVRFTARRDAARTADAPRLLTRTLYTDHHANKPSKLFLTFCSEKLDVVRYFSVSGKYNNIFIPYHLF